MKGWGSNDEYDEPKKLSDSEISRLRKIINKDKAREKDDNFSLTGRYFGGDND